MSSFYCFEAFDIVPTQKSITYFNTQGPENTDEARALRLAREGADELEVREVIIASTRGETGVKTSKDFKEFRLVVVTYATVGERLEHMKCVTRTA